MTQARCLLKRAQGGFQVRFSGQGLAWALGIQGSGLGIQECGAECQVNRNRLLVYDGSF